MSEVFEIINEEQVEQRFGGKAPNVVPGSNRLFPPILPSENYHRNKEKELISELEYKELYKENKLSVVGEYYSEKWRLEEEENVKRRQYEEIEKVRNINNINEEHKMKVKKIEYVGNMLDNSNIFSEKDLNIIKKEIVLNEFNMSTKGKIKEINLISKSNKNRMNKIFEKKVLLTPNIISSNEINKITINQKPQTAEVYDRKSFIDERPTNYLEAKKLEIGLNRSKHEKSAFKESLNLSDNVSENLFDSKSQIQMFSQKICNIY